MSFTSWLRNWKRSAPAPSIRRRSHSSRRRLEILEERTLLSGNTYMVNLAGDAGTGSGLTGDIRYCIAQADQSANAGSTITFDTAQTGSTIRVTQGELVISDTMTITGPGASSLTINGNNSSRLFDVASGGSLTLENVTLSGGRAVNIGSTAAGGAIYSSGTLVLSGVTVQNNSAAGYDADANGGGIYVAGGSATLTNDTIGSNRAAGGDGSNASITGSGAIHGGGGNGANAYGGGLYVAAGTVTLTNDTISSNQAVGGGGGIGAGEAGAGSGGDGSGGGLDVAAGTVTLTNDTLSGNQAVGGNAGFGGPGGPGGYTSSGAYIPPGSPDLAGDACGGGLYLVGGSLTLNNDTISSNSTAGGTGGPIVGGGAASGGGIGDAAGPGALQMYNTIVADDLTGGIITSLGYNLIGNSTAAFGFVASDLLNVNPLLGPLQNNGGPTLTMALLPGSPAINAGDNTNAPAYDQRGPGFPRIIGGAIDIGAFEVQNSAATVPTLTAPANQEAGQNIAAALNLGSFVEAGNAGPWTVLVDWGDGTAPTQLSVTAQGSLGQQTHTFATTGTDTVTVSVTDPSDVSASATFTVTVNPAPSLSLAGPTDGVAYQQRTFTLTTTDLPGDDAAGFTYRINYGDGSPVETVPATPNNTTQTVSHAYASTGTFNVSVTVTDQFGAVSMPATDTVTIGLAVVESDNAADGGITGLAVSGSSASGGIVLTPTGNSYNVKVSRGGTFLGTFKAPDGNVAIFGDGGTDLVTLRGLDNSADNFTLTGNTTAYTAASLGAKVFTIELDGISQVTFDGGATGNAFTNNDATVPSVLVGGAGANTFTFSGSGMGAPARVRGSGNDNTLYGPTLAGGVANIWKITGANAGNLNGTSWPFTGVQNLTGGAGTNTFMIGTDGSLTGMITGGNGGNTLVGPGLPNTFKITGINAGNLTNSNGAIDFSSIQNLTGGPATTNSFVIGPGASVTGMIVGQGTSRLDYSGYAAAVYVNLVSGKATGAGGVSHIQQVYGSGHNDVLVGSGSGILLQESAGDNLIIGGTGQATLDSGSGQDLVIAGSTSYDNNQAALLAIESYWADTANTEATRVAGLTSGITAGKSTYKLTTSTVKHAAASATIVLGSANDWVFWQNYEPNEDKLTGTPAFSTYI